MEKKEEDIISLLVSYGFEEKVARKVYLIINGLIDDINVIECNKEATKQKYRYSPGRIREIVFNSENTKGSIKLLQNGLNGKIIDFDKKCRLDLFGTSCNIIKLNPDSNLDEKIVLVNIIKDKKLGKIKRVRGYSEEVFNSFGLDDNDFLIRSSFNQFDSLNPLYDNTSSMEEELRVINKGKNKTINIDEYFHILVGYILSSKVNVENKLVLK